MAGQIHDHQRPMDPSPLRTTPPLEEEDEWGMLCITFPICSFIFFSYNLLVWLLRKFGGKFNRKVVIFLHNLYGFHLVLEKSVYPQPLIVLCTLCCIWELVASIEIGLRLHILVSNYLVLHVVLALQRSLLSTFLATGSVTSGI